MNDHTVNDAPAAAALTALTDDALVSRILDVFAQEARIERSRLQLDLRADELGVGSLDLALAVFELEDRFGVPLPDPPAEATVGEIVQQMLAALGPRGAAAAAAAATTATAANAAP